MKDFKSQRYFPLYEYTDDSIDTPGVIERVSTLFRGHPNLIQGFNTFLPPGYRIECSDDPMDPNPIKVTTPMGTTTSTGGPPLPPQPHIQERQPPMYRNEPWPGREGYPEQPPVYDRDRDAGFYGAGSNGQIAQLQAAATGRRGDTKGPVEFNHAINYVNKIKVSPYSLQANVKNRFTDKPDVYKNFLEILQTYQREQRPIQEVYTQVTRLFEAAPDLLEDFKQFLPDTSASAAGAPIPGGGRSMPPVGSFAPPPSTMPPKKKRPSHTMESVQPAPQRPSGQKRSKHRHAPAPEMETLEPTLVPQFPEPLGPPPKLVVTTDEVAFFEKLKKNMNNKATYNEFLKLINMYTNDIVDKNTLVQRAEAFLQNYPDQFAYFKGLVKYTGQDEIIDNIPIAKARVDLNHCKKYGPSYRQLPKSEAKLQCSGRDDMCWEVLNDDWVSHPTWASEEGFTAHRKNQHEEALHKCEEERYEYDLNIEANLRTIQLLEPIAQRISSMTAEEKNNFKLPPGLGGSSLAIYQRVIKKIYDREKGLEVIEAIHDNPAAAVPVVLQRLKQKDEEWKRAQREWNKVWRETEARNFLKSLDHMGPQFKSLDKKAINTKTLLTELEVRSKQDKDKRMNPLTPKKKYHFNFVFEDGGVIMDAGVLIAHALREAPNRPADVDGMLDFLKKFLPMFFSLHEGTVEQRLNETSESADTASMVVEEDGTTTPSRKARKAGRSESNLLKDVLKRTRKSKEKPIRSSVASRESTPGADQSPSATPRETPFSETDINGDPGSGADDDVTMNDADAEETEREIQYAVKEAAETWIQPATADVNRPREGFSGRAVVPSEDFTTQEVRRHVYNLFGNNAIYYFFRMFQMLYSRLYELKVNGPLTTPHVKFSNPNPVAVEFGFQTDAWEDLDKEVEEAKSRYPPLLELCKRIIEQDQDNSQFEDAVRHLYGTKGYKIYTVDKLIAAIIKQLSHILTDQKTTSILMLYETDRLREKTTPRDQIIYRIQVEGIIGSDDHVVRFEWVSLLENPKLIVQDDELRRLGIQLLNKEDLTLDQATTREEQWAYYVDSYYMHADTEGVPTDMLASPWIRRSAIYRDFLLSDNFLFINGLQVKICLNTYKLFYLVNTEDTLVRKKEARAVPVRQLNYNRAARKQDGLKWTRNGHVTKEEQNAAAAAEAQAKEKEMEIEQPVQTEVPAAGSVPPSETIQSPGATPAPVPAPVASEPTAIDDVKNESPLAPIASGEVMDDVETSNPLPETTQEVPPPPAAEDVEMQDA